MMEQPDCRKLTFVDVEYANDNADCICEIGISAWEDGREVYQHTELIDPQTYFSDQTIRIHGIYPEDVEGCRTFGEFYQDAREYFQPDWVLVGHNINSDINVIKNDLARIGMDLPALWCIDTQDVVRKCVYKGQVVRGSMSLSAVCKFMDIGLHAHYALDDCLACTEIIAKVLADDPDVNLQDFLKKPETEKEDQKRKNIKFWKTLQPGITLLEENMGEVVLKDIDEEHVIIEKNGITMTYRFPFCFLSKALQVLPENG